MNQSTEYRRAITKYIYGGAASLILTMLAYGAFVTNIFTIGKATATAILLLAIVQVVVQVWYFLHLDAESKPRWKITTILFTTAMVIVVVAGSLWVIANMNYNMNMSSGDMREYMIEQNKKGF